MNEVLAKYGLAGLVIAVLAGVVVWQQRRIDKIQGEKDELQNLRLSDIVGFKDQLARLTEGSTQTYQLLLAKLEGQGK